MIYELMTYTCIPGSQAIVASNAATVAREIRGDDYGKLEGYWLSEVGTLNQVVHLWSYSSFDERARLRLALADNKRWVQEYIPLIRPHLLRQEVRLLLPILAFKPPATGGNIYEYRAYRAKPTMVRAWAKLFGAAMTVRERYSTPVCGWVTDAGQPNEVSHLWAYSSFEARMRARSAAGADPQWQAFLKEAGPLLEEMSTTLMLPASHSPLS